MEELQVWSKARNIMLDAIEHIKYKYPRFIELLSSLSIRSTDYDILIETNWRYIFYNPERVEGAYKYANTSNLIIEKLLHILLHAVSGDMMAVVSDKIRIAAWGMMNEKVNIIGSNNYDEYTCFPQLSEVEREILEDEKSFGDYRAILSNPSIRKRMASLYLPNKNDNHEWWNCAFEPGRAITEDEWCDYEEARGNVIKVIKGMEKGVENKKDKHFGSTAGDQTVYVDASKEVVTDYKTFLERFLKTYEITREDPDTIDSMMYQYGLSIYEDVPLVEPMETCESKSFDNICIAIDTSGSCQGKLIRQFVGETLELIRTVSTNYSSGNIYILQCDYEIQKELLIETGNIDAKRVSNMEIKGFGGTSFDPVFERLEELKNEGKKIDLLMYLTDGMGEINSKKPDYPVAFAMTKGDIELVGNSLPKWIKQVIIEK